MTELEESSLIEIIPSVENKISEQGMLDKIKA